MMATSVFLPFLTKTAAKQWCNCGGFAVFSFAEPSAAQDFCGNEISMADNSLQKTAETVSRAMWLPIPPAGLVYRMNASEHEPPKNSLLSGRGSEA
jgi:hypothetical protein